MLDINFIIENQKKVKEVIKDKGLDLDLDKLLKIDKKRRQLIQDVEKIREERNNIANQLKDPKKRTDQLVKQGKKIKDEMTKADADLKPILDEFNKLMLKVPNVYSEDTPIGPDETANKEVKKSGKIPKFSFKIKNHIELGKDLDIIDLDRGVKVHGFRGYFLKNQGAQLHLAVLMYTWNKLIAKGFTPMIPPTIVKETALEGSGFFPFVNEEVFQIANPGRLESGQEEKDPLFLAGTSEPSLLTYRANEILEEKELPIKYCGFSQCYRSEVGSYGKDTKGLYRVHEFTKIEQVILIKASIDQGLKELEELRKISEEILEDLKLPYHTVQVCTGDMGAGKYKMYDIETWMPSREKYSETHSDSYLTDWQTRRLNLKYKDKTGKIQYCHALNNTGIASPRILIAILENFQQKDGSIVIPEVLRPYMNGIDVIKTK